MLQSTQNQLSITQHIRDQWETLCRSLPIKQLQARTITRKEDQNWVAKPCIYPDPLLRKHLKLLLITKR